MTTLVALCSTRKMTEILTILRAFYSTWWPKSWPYLSIPVLHHTGCSLFYKSDRQDPDYTDCTLFHKTDGQDPEHTGCSLIYMTDGQDPDHTCYSLSYMTDGWDPDLISCSLVYMGDGQDPYYTSCSLVYKPDGQDPDHTSYFLFYLTDGQDPDHTGCSPFYMTDGWDHDHTALCSTWQMAKNLITKTCLYNFDPLKPHFHIVKLGFRRVYIIFLISAQKHRLWVLVRTALPRQF